MSQVHNISPVDSSGVVRCYAHGLEASLMTSISLNNPGRQYYCCCKGLSDPDRCRFWYWADDPVFQKRRDRQASSEPSYYLLNTPSSSQIGPPTTPSRKRSLSNSLPSTQGSEATRRRKLIEDALKTPSIRPQDRTQKSALRSPQKRLEDIQLALSASKGPNAGTKTSHPLAHASPPTPTRIISSQPSVSSSRTLGSFPASSVSREESDDEDSELWVRVTPPRILEDVFLGAHVGTVSSEKGSQETIAGPSYSNRRDDDENNPFDQSSQVSNSTSESSPYVSALTSFDATSSDQSAETSTFRSFDEISRQMARLERKLLASEKSNNAKARRISELMEVIERLQEENRALGGSVDSYLPPRH